MRLFVVAWLWHFQWQETDHSFLTLFQRSKQFCCHPFSSSSEFFTYNSHICGSSICNNLASFLCAACSTDFNVLIILEQNKKKQWHIEEKYVHSYGYRHLNLFGIQYRKKYNSLYCLFSCLFILFCIVHIPSFHPIDLNNWSNYCSHWNTIKIKIDIKFN